MSTDPVDVIAHTLLYEGYLLYPYRRSALKNQQRFNFGVLHPRDSQEARAGDEAWQLQVQCPVQGADDTWLDLSVRFLHLVARGANDGGGADGTAGWQEAIEREVRVGRVTLGVLRRAVVREAFSFPAGSAADPHDARDASRSPGTRMMRTQRALAGDVEVTADAAAGDPNGPPCTIVTVCVSNRTMAPNVAGRDAALLHAFVSTHVAMRVSGGSFVSLLDPPEALRSAASRCSNVGVWPVLVGQEGSTDRLLASPIILYDYPQIAPESAGDLFDGTEIDEILALRILTMTDAEKREARETDDRAREILDRTEALPEEHWQKLHGAVRGLRKVSGGAR